MSQLDGLVNAGNTVVVIQHEMRRINTALRPYPFTERAPLSEIAD